MAGRIGVLFGLMGLLGLLAGGPALAQEAVPERRAVTVADTDFFGGDIRSIFDTTQAICVAACLAEPTCRGFTYNIPNGACFLKSSVDRRDPYPGAVSGEIVAVPEALRMAARARLAALPTVPQGLADAARAQATAIGPENPAPAGATATAPETGGNTPGTLAALARAIGQGDRAEDWLAYARTARAIREDDGTLRAAGLSAALNAYLRFDAPADAARALTTLAQALEEAGEGRASLDALRRAQALDPRPVTLDAVARAEARFGFRVLEHVVDSDAAAPRLCLSFSQPLIAAGFEYAPFLRQAGVELPVSVEGSSLCLDGLIHGARVALTVRAGLRAADGEVLAAPVEIEAYVRDRTPQVRFTGRAHVLPRTPDAAMPLVSVNAPEAEIRILRLGERNLLPAIQDNLVAAPLDAWGEGRVAGQRGEEVWRGTASLATRLNQDVTTALPLGDAVATFAPGVYAMTARVPDRGEPWETAATQWFIVTDLGLATTSGADGLHVFVRALGTAQPVAGSTLRLLAANNEVLGEAVSDPQGYARFDPGLLRGSGGAEPALLTVAAAGDFAFLDLSRAGFDLSDRGVEGRPAPPPIDLYVATERGAYRPGETLHATILARDTRADAIAGLALTAIVTRPDGVEQTRVVLADEGAGGRSLRLPLSPSAQRGTWRLALHADPEAPALASAAFLVEDFTPERIDFDLGVPDGPVDPAAPGTVAVAARFLYGAPGADLGIEGDVSVRGTRALPGFPGAVFGLEDEGFASAYAPLAPGLRTGADGAAAVPLVLPVLPATTQPLSLTATLRLTDGSGRPVERSLERPLRPAGPQLGLRPLFQGDLEEGAVARFEVLAAGPDLAPAALGSVTWTVSRIETTYQWYGLDGDWRFEPVTTRTRVATGTLATAPDAPGVIEVPLTWGRFELKAAATDPAYTAASTTFAAGWFAAEGGTDTPDRLTVGLDKPAYRPGDTALLRLGARMPGEVLVQVVTDRLVAMVAQSLPAGESEIALPVTDAWGPGAYVTATLIRPMEVAARRNPARALGLAYAAVDPGPRALTVRWLTPDTADPRGPLTVAAVIEGLAEGEAAHATLSAVDVGILNLTAHPAPDPAEHYFGQRRLGVAFRDLYGALIDGLSGEPGQLRSGGDGFARFDAPPPTEDLVAFQSGTLRAGPDGRVEATFTLPAFNGAVRLSAIAWTARGVGAASKEIAVRDPVVVQASGPRVLAPGDRAAVRVELAHAAGPAGEVTVAVAADPVLGLAAQTRRVALTEGGRVALALPLAPDTTGTGRVALTVTTPGGARLESGLTLTVRRPDAEVARQTRITLGPGAAGLPLDAGIFAGFVPGTGRATLAAGPLAQLDVPGLLAALDAYPYGCTEQVASRALGLLSFAPVAEAMGLGDVRETGERIASAIAALLENQGGAGSFGLWAPGAEDLWLDAYVTDVLARARALGHAVPEPAFQAALDSLRSQVSYAGGAEAAGPGLAYALMVLAREGSAPVGDLRYVADVEAERFATPLARAQLGAALAFTGDQRRADRLFGLAEAALATPDDGAWRADYGSVLRDAAGVLALAAGAGSRAVDLAALATRVAPRGADVGRRSTQENAWALLAAEALIGSEGAGTPGLTLDGIAVAGPPALLLRDGEPARVLGNAGDAPVAIVVTAFGIPEGPGPAEGNGYRIARDYYTLDGAATDLSDVPRGTRLVAVLTVTPEREGAARLMVSDPLPAGFEIDNPSLLRGGDVAALGWLPDDSPARHAEFRADRFLAAVDWSGAEAFRLAYILRAVSPGSFHHAAASVEDMYRPAWRARTGAGRAMVRE